MIDTLHLNEYVVENRVGRLVTTRLCSMHDLRQVAQVQLAMSRILEKVGHRAVICADWRAIDIFAPEIAEGVVNMLAVTNLKVEQSAILLEPQKATFNLQAERVIRDARNPARKSFRDPDKLLDWLAMLLEPGEVQNAKEFLESSAIGALRDSLRPVSR